MSDAQPITNDLLEYFGTADAQQAEPWQLAALARMRRALNRPLTGAQYARLRATLARTTAPKPARRLNR
jgi:hypothetical protein